ncbi:MAG: gluconokinase [Spirulinaceae cyanobacterium]
MTIILMGVSGSGKTTIGRLLAQKMEGVFQDADWFHPSRNIEKMSQGEPLTDRDREPWLDILGNAIQHWNQEKIPYILACSALKQKYRDRLQQDNEGVTWVYLKGSKSLILQRTRERTDHFMPSSLLDSQFTTLEEPQNALIVSIDSSPDAIASAICEGLS